jgi:hypothetical protein
MTTNVWRKKDCSPFFAHTLPLSPFSKITIPHNENKFLCEFIAFVCDDFKENFYPQQKREVWEEKKKMKPKHIVIQPTLKAAKALKWKEASTVSVTMNGRERRSKTFVFESVLLRLHATRFLLRSTSAQHSDFD